MGIRAAFGSQKTKRLVTGSGATAWGTVGMECVRWREAMFFGHQQGDKRDYSFGIRREKGRGKRNLQHSFRLHAPLTAPRITTLKSKTIHVSMAEGCTYAATAPSPQAAALLPGSGSISPWEKPFQSCGCWRHPTPSFAQASWQAASQQKYAPRHCTYSNVKLGDCEIPSIASQKTKDLCAAACPHGVARQWFCAHWNRVLCPPAPPGCRCCCTVAPALCISHHPSSWKHLKITSPSLRIAAAIGILL